MNKTARVSFIFIISVILFSYWGIWNIFFQQDEWLGVGGALYRQETFGTLGSIGQVFNFETRNESTRFLPVAAILNHFVYSNIGLNFNIYGILALFLVIASALVLNLTIQKLTNSWLLSALVSIFWVTNNLAYQAFTWIGTLVPTVASALFFMGGLYFLLLFNEKRKNLYIVLSFLSVLISLFSKEYSYFYVFPYIAIIWFFFRDKIGITRKLGLIFLFLTPLLISIFLPRGIYLLYGQSNFAPPIGAAGITDTIYNVFLLPAKSLYHVFLPSSLIHEHVYSISRTVFENQTDGFVISRIVGDAFSLLVAFYILLVVALTLAFAKSDIKKLILFSLFSFFASFAPFIIFKNSDVILEPRFYILPAVFSSLLTVSVIYAFTSKLKYASKFLTVLIIAPLLLFNIQGVKKMLAIDVEVGTYRRGMLNTVSEVKPSLAKDNIFYFFTGHTGFWEFQSGFGQTLAVWLYDTGEIPKEVLVDRDFWDLSFEGIKEYPEGKYGYFMTYGTLTKALQENPDISLGQVHSYYWDYQKHTVENVSEEIREKLVKE